MSPIEFYLVNKNGLGLEGLQQRKFKIALQVDVLCYFEKIVRVTPP